MRAKNGIKAYVCTNTIDVKFPMDIIGKEK